MYFHRNALEWKNKQKRAPRCYRCVTNGNNEWSKVSKMTFERYEARFLPLNTFLTILTFHRLHSEKNWIVRKRSQLSFFFKLKSVHFLNFAIFCEICWFWKIWRLQASTFPDWRLEQKSVQTMYSCLKLITEAIGANGFYNQLRLVVLFEVSQYKLNSI